MFGRLGARIRSEARAASRMGLAAIFLAVGAGFLTAALYIALAAAQGTTVALLVIGGGYTAIGMGLVLWARSVAPTPRGEPAAGDIPVAAMIEAFAVGMAAGRQAR